MPWSCRPSVLPFLPNKIILVPLSLYWAAMSFPIAPVPPVTRRFCETVPAVQAGLSIQNHSLYNLLHRPLKIMQGLYWQEWVSYTNFVMSLILWSLTMSKVCLGFKLRPVWSYDETRYFAWERAYLAWHARFDCWNCRRLPRGLAFVQGLL